MVLAVLVRAAGTSHRSPAGLISPTALRRTSSRRAAVSISALTNDAPGSSISSSARQMAATRHRQRARPFGFPCGA